MTTTTDDGGGSTSFKPFANSNQTNDGNDDDENDMDIPLPVRFVAVSLQQLKAKLDFTPYDMKSSFVYAQQTWYRFSQ